MPVSKAPRKKQAQRSSQAKKSNAEAQQQALIRQQSTPLYVVVASLTFLLAGIVIVILNFLDILKGGSLQQYSFIGIGFISLGLIAATQIK